MTKTIKPHTLKLALANQLAFILLDDDASHVKHIIDENSYLIIRHMRNGRDSFEEELPSVVLAYVKSNPRWIPDDKQFARYEASGVHAYIPSHEDYAHPDKLPTAEEQKEWIMRACMDMTHRIASRDYRGNRCVQSASGKTLNMLNERELSRVTKIVNHIEGRMD